MYRFRWPVLIASLVPVVAALWLVAHGGTFHPPAIPRATESGRAAHLIEGELPARPATFELIFSHPTLAATSPEFVTEVRRVVTQLARDPRVRRVITGYDGEPRDPGFFSRDGHRTRAVVELDATGVTFASVEFATPVATVYHDLYASVRSDTLRILPAGILAMQWDFKDATQKDLHRIELLVLPAVLILLLLVFRSVLAALVPLVVGLLAVMTGVAGAGLLARVTPMSIYATNVMTMIGLGVAIDYSLFIVSRFREEVRHRSVPEAVSVTLATAGHAVIFAGATVAVGLLGMAFISIENLDSMGYAGTIVVAFSVLYSVTFLPALLSILGRRIDAGRIPFLKPLAAPEPEGFWHRLATFVMRHPWGVLVPVTLFLLMLGTPFLNIRLGSGDVTSLPEDAPSRRGEEILRAEFPGAHLNPIVVVVHDPDGEPVRPDRVDALWELSRWLARQPHVVRVQSPLDLDPSITREQYRQLFSAPPEFVPAEIRTALGQMVGRHVVLMIVQSDLEVDSDAARQLVRTIRTSHPPVPGTGLLVSGRTAFDIDFIHTMATDAPRVVGFVVVATYVVLVLLLGSVVLPLKAVVMNFLSITASYGALVWIFQEGHLAGLLNFEPRSVETPVPIVMFCVLFGLSMDYEVLLLSRIREEYEASADNDGAVGRGLEHTGRLITGAAAIMAGVFFGFGLAHTIVIKAMGVAMGIAVVLDATIVRALLVPATMRLLGSWNWVAPRFVRRIYRRLTATTTR